MLYERTLSAYISMHRCCWDSEFFDLSSTSTSVLFSWCMPWERERANHCGWSEYDRKTACIQGIYHLGRFPCYGIETENIRCEHIEGILVSRAFSSSFCIEIHFVFGCFCYFNTSACNLISQHLMENMRCGVTTKLELCTCFFAKWHFTPAECDYHFAKSQLVRASCVY